MLKNITVLLTALVLFLVTTCSFAISPGAGQAQIRSNTQQMEQTKKQMKQMKQLQENQKMDKQNPMQERTQQ